MHCHCSESLFLFRKGPLLPRRLHAAVMSSTHCSNLAIVLISPSWQLIIPHVVHVLVAVCITSLQDLDNCIRAETYIALILL